MAQKTAAHTALILNELQRSEGSALSAEVRTLLEQLDACPNGCQWFRGGDGFRCAGGGHMLHRSRLDAEFALAAAPVRAGSRRKLAPAAPPLVVNSELREEYD